MKVKRLFIKKVYFLKLSFSEKLKNPWLFIASGRRGGTVSQALIFGSVIFGLRAYWFRTLSPASYILKDCFLTNKFLKTPCSFLNNG